MYSRVSCGEVHPFYRLMITLIRDTNIAGFCVPEHGRSPEDKALRKRARHRGVFYKIVHVCRCSVRGPRYDSRPILVQQAHGDQNSSLTECLYNIQLTYVRTLPFIATSELLSHSYRSGVKSPKHPSEFENSCQTQT
jgi:hypothetical protein